MKYVRFESDLGAYVEVNAANDGDIVIEAGDGDGNSQTVYLPATEARELGAYLIEMADRADPKGKVAK